MTGITGCVLVDAHRRYLRISRRRESRTGRWAQDGGKPRSARARQKAEGHRDTGNGMPSEPPGGSTRSCALVAPHRGSAEQHALPRAMRQQQPQRAEEAEEQPNAGVKDETSAVAPHEMTDLDAAIAKTTTSLQRRPLARTLHAHGALDDVHAATAARGLFREDDGWCGQARHGLAPRSARCEAQARTVHGEDRTLEPMRGLSASELLAAPAAVPLRLRPPTVITAAASAESESELTAALGAADAAEETTPTRQAAVHHPKDGRPFGTLRAVSGAAPVECRRRAELAAADDDRPAAGADEATAAAPGVIVAATTQCAPAAGRLGGVEPLQPDTPLGVDGAAASKSQQQASTTTGAAGAAAAASAGAPAAARGLGVAHTPFTPDFSDEARAIAAGVDAAPTPKSGVRRPVSARGRPPLPPRAPPPAKSGPRAAATPGTSRPRGPPSPLAPPPVVGSGGAVVAAAPAAVGCGCRPSSTAPQPSAGPSAPPASSAPPPPARRGVRILGPRGCGASAVKPAPSGRAPAAAAAAADAAEAGGEVMAGDDGGMQQQPAARAQITPSSARSAPPPSYYSINN